MFNIKIILVKELKPENNEYKILSLSQNNSDNILYISVNATELEQNIEYHVLGYKRGKYNVFIFFKFIFTSYKFQYSCIQPTHFHSIYYEHDHVGIYAGT